MPEEQKKKQIGVERFKLLSWPGHDLIQPIIEKMWGRELLIHRCSGSAHGPSVYEAMVTGKPYPVKAMITMAANPLLNMPDSKLVYRGIKNLELHVVKDYWMTPSAQLADYVLPTAGWIERPNITTGWGTDCGIVAGEQALPASVPGEKDCRTDFDFFRGLGIRLGQEEYWPWETLEEAYNYQLSPFGMTLKEFMAQPHGGIYLPPREYKKYERMGGFATLTGKYELYSTALEKLGYDPLPKYEEARENPVTRPDLAKDYPLTLLTGCRFEPYYHSEHRQIDSIRKSRPDPHVQINPGKAKELGIDNGDWVWIETVRGRIRMRAELFEGIKPTVVHAEHGWWFPELPGEEPWLHGLWESNVNVLTTGDPDVCAKATGGWPFKTNLCKIYKAKHY
jgi:anaerobic selenocysteine-containing dehydrogenase